MTYEVLDTAIDKMDCHDLIMALSNRVMAGNGPVDAVTLRSIVAATICPNQHTSYLWIPMRTAICKVTAVDPNWTIMAQHMVDAGIPLSETYWHSVESSGFTGVTILHDAARLGSPEFVGELLRLGADPSARCRRGFNDSKEATPLVSPLELAMERTDEHANEVVEVIRAALARTLIAQVLADDAAPSAPVAAGL